MDRTKKYGLTAASLIALALAVATPARGAVSLPPAAYPWYVGAMGGTSFGMAGFRSISEYKTWWGAQGGVLGGYRFNRLISLEGALQFGAQTQGPLRCCPYWLSESNAVLEEPTPGETCWSFFQGDGVTPKLTNKTQWTKFTVMGNVDFVGGLLMPGLPISATVSPLVALLSSKTKLSTPDGEKQYAGQFHFGFGAQVALGYTFAERIGASLYGGMTSFLGKHFDDMPITEHSGNIIWEVGVKLSYSLGKRNTSSYAAKSRRRSAQQDSDVPSWQDDGRDDHEAEDAPFGGPADKADGLPTDEGRQDESGEDEAGQEGDTQDAGADDAAVAGDGVSSGEGAVATEGEPQPGEEPEDGKWEEGEDGVYRQQQPSAYFANNSSLPAQECEPSLEMILERLEQHPEYRLEVNAFASNSGSKRYNQWLSELRAKSLARWFEDRGIAPERFVVRGHGIDYNAPDDFTARRAEIYFIK